MKIINFTIKRSGPAMTIHGVDQATGRPVKVTNITEVKSGQFPGLSFSVATGADGTTYELV